MDLIEAPLLKYQPLREPNSIRLLILQPGPLGSEIRCSLVYTTVSDCRNDIYDHYTALSYVWGDPTDTTTIIVDGQPFQATVNLAAALDDLRDDERPLRMWVDAICINQASILERNTQVGLMRDIYSTAQRTVVYLGKSASDFDHILRDLRSAKEAKAAWETIEEETRKSFTIQFLSYPWFTRVWIYQELVLSREVWVQCGRVRIAWDKLCNILIGVDRSKLRDRSHNQQGQMELLSSMFETREKFKMSLIDGSKPQSLRQILSTRRGMGVSDLRDMIFGHLAVAGLHQPEVVALGNFPPPTADYTKTIPEVFTNAASYIYTSSDTVELLLDVEVSNCSRRLQSLPSWVPDWSLAPSARLYSIPPHFPRGGYDAVNLKKRKAFCLSRPPILAFESFQLTRFQEISSIVVPPLPEIWRRERIFYASAVRDFNEPASDATWDSAPENIKKEHVLRAMHQSWQGELGGGFLPELEAHPRSLTETTHFSISWYNLLKQDEDPTKYTASVNYTFLEQFLDHFFDNQYNHILPGRRIANLPPRNGLSRKGIAIVPEGTHPADLLYALRFNLGRTEHTAIMRACGDEVSPAARLAVFEELQSQGCHAYGGESALFHGRFIGTCLLDKEYRDLLQETRGGKCVVVLH